MMLIVELCALLEERVCVCVCVLKCTEVTSLCELLIFCVICLWPISNRGANDIPIRIYLTLQSRLSARTKHLS